MSSFLATLSELIQSVNGIVWSVPLVVLLLCAGLYFSIRTRFVQLRYVPKMCRLLFGSRGRDNGGRSSFQAFAMALSGRVGTGNIVGVATAIAFGGPGAIVWMWIIAFLGAGTAFAESTLAQVYKERDGREFRGGPAYYIEKGLGSRAFGMVFAFLTLISMGLLMPPIQSNSIATAMTCSTGLPMWVFGVVVTAVLALIVIGGVKRIASFAEWVTPIAAVLYVLLSLVILAAHINLLPGVLADMLRSAVGLNPALGGIFGTMVMWGVKRGLYSNEAGQGTGAMSSAAAGVAHPVEQGLVQAFSVYIDTLLVCSATAVMILACKTYNIVESVDLLPGGGSVCHFLVQNPGVSTDYPGVQYTSAAVASLTGTTAANIIISIALFFFAFTTILAYYYYAETSIVYLFTRLAKRHDPRLAARGQRHSIYVLRVANLAMVFLGSVISAGEVWMLGDIGCGSMAWINVIAILLLSPKLLRVFKDYERQYKSDKKATPHFDPAKLNIKNADCWGGEGQNDQTKGMAAGSR